MRNGILPLKYEMAKDRDRFEHTLGDALDAKGAFFLVAIALFITVLIQFSLVDAPIATWAWKSLLGWTVGTLVASMAYLFAAVWQRTYKLPFVPSRYEPWIDLELNARIQRGMPEEAAQMEILELHRQHLMKFIDTNHEINKTKSDHVGAATRFFMASCAGMLPCLVLQTLRFPF
jgi:hypothetical protein